MLERESGIALEAPDVAPEDAWHKQLLSVLTQDF